MDRKWGKDRRMTKNHKKRQDEPRNVTNTNKVTSNKRLKG